MATAELDIKIDSRDVPNATRELKRLEQQGAATDGKMRSLGDASSGAGGKLDGAAKAAKSMGVALAAMGVAKVAVDMAKLADQTNLLHSRVSRLAGDLPDVTYAWNALLETANESGASMSDTVKLWESLDQSVKATDAQIITLTATLQKLGKIGGASSEEMGNSLRQLSQSFAGGIVRAEEFNSVLEQTPEIWRRVATAQGISLGELRTKMLEGKLTADEVFNSLMSQVDSVNADFEKMPRTIEQASQALSNNFAGAVAALDNQIGTSKFLSKMLDALARGAAEFTLQIEAAPGAEASVALNEIDAQLAKMAESRAAYDAVVASGDSAAIAAMAMGGSSQEAMNRLRAQEIALLERRDQILGEMADREGGKAPPSAGSGMSSAASGPKTTTAVDDKKAKEAADKQAKQDARKREMQLQSAQAWLEQTNQLGATELEQIDYWHQQELAKLREFEQQKAITVMDADAARKALDEESARRRMELEDKVLQKSLEASRLKAQAERQATDQMASMQWGLASQSLDAISMAAEEGSTMQKAAFIAGKGMAAAQAIMQAELASVSTLAAYAAAAAAAGPGGPALLAAGTAQAAAMKTMGYASAAIIAAQGFAGMFDNGGNIGSGQWGIVGENGPEIVKGPANVTSRKKTAAMAASAMEGGSAGTVINLTQNIYGNGDEALAKVVRQASDDALNRTQQDFAGNGRLRKTLGV